MKEEEEMKELEEIKELEDELPHLGISSHYEIKEIASISKPAVNANVNAPWYARLKVLHNDLEVMSIFGSYQRDFGQIIPNACHRPAKNFFVMSLLIPAAIKTV
ncbi:hypothetical protein AVEN_195878-1 [Araneus ventricosus]|uniref:Uncharacterized protein n=1 Tax=Araneus ventricosus TaxID=182803 RepID=A0A4Y2DXF2_ARAVE|nr:hypothetical protein AVEN_195878-1 [Araneus ventricosus]